MGERLQGTLFRPNFNSAVVVEPAGTDLTGDAGALVIREAADRLDVAGALAGLHDPRDPDLVRYPLVDLVLSRLLLTAQGWQDQDDLDALRTDPAFRLASNTRRGDKALNRPLPSQPTMSRLLGNLGTDANREVLAEAQLDVAFRRYREDRGSADRLVVDVDSFAVPAHGEQEGVRFNAHYGMNCLHPLAAFLDTGDLVALDLRAGNVHTATDASLFLEAVLDRAQEVSRDVWVRIDSGFAAGHFFDDLDARGVRFVTRLRTNAALQRAAVEWRERTVERWRRTRVPGAAPREETFEFWHQAQAWSRKRRVVAVLVERDDRQGDLFEHLFFLATNAPRPMARSRAILRLYRQRGIAEQRIGELIRDFLPHFCGSTLDVNEAALRLAGLAYQVAHLLRRRLEKHRGEGLSMRRLRERFLRAAAHVVRHARRVVFRIGAAFVAQWQQLAEVLEAALPADVVAAEGLAG